MSRPASLSSFAGLHVLADDDPRWPGDPPSQARLALAGGARVIQLRAKNSSDRQILDWARQIRELTRASGASFVLNDRFDLAWISEADAVHLGQDDLPPASIPASLRAELRVGRSTHDIEQARQALRENVDYLAFGPIFGTTSKHTPYRARGLDDLEKIVSQSGDVPVVAIGGIDAQNLPSVLAAGASGAAVISAVIGNHEPEQATRLLCTCFDAELERDQPGGVGG